MRIVFCIAAICLSGCATHPRQTEAVLRHPPPIPASFEIKNVPYIEQASGYCGPATLTMAMQWAGRDITVGELGPTVMTPGKTGSLQLDLISASRRQGLLAIPISGMESLLKEIASGHPVIIFENLALSWYPQWHYAIVFGYDLSNQELLMHSGDEANKRWSMSYFERSWMLADYWGLVVLPPDQLSASADELSHMRAAAGLEQTGHDMAAEQAYKTILKKWPESLGAWIGLGNLAYKKNNYEGAVRFLKKATKLHPDSQMAKHNLEVAQSAVRY